jgi:hypothetical protein
MADAGYGHINAIADQAAPSAALGHAFSVRRTDPVCYPRAFYFAYFKMKCAAKIENCFRT